MAINPETQYPGKIEPASTEFPYGKARNITLPSDGTGTPFEAALVNDIFGFQQSLLKAGGIVPSGTPDEVGASQYLEALKKLPSSGYTILLDLQNDASNVDIGKSYRVDERTLSDGGASWWTAISKTTENGFDIVTGNASISFKLLVDVIVDVKQFGAKGDGVADDTTAIQFAIDSGAKHIYIPEGVYLLSDTLKLPHTGSYYREDTGITISGAGAFTILTRGQITQETSAAESSYQTEACISIFGSNNIIEKLSIEDTKLGIYMGQSSDVAYATEPSSISFNKIRDIRISGAGTAILMACASGSHYNLFETIHMYQCQIGLKMTEGEDWFAANGNLSNNNRNTFQTLRASRCQVGFWIENGDTNSLYSCHAEGCKEVPSNNSYGVPAGLPGGLTTSAFIIDGADNNDLYGCMTESNDHNLYLNSNFIQFFGCIFRANEEPASVDFIILPKLWLSRNETWLQDGNIRYLSNNAPWGEQAGAIGTKGVKIEDHNTIGKRSYNGTKAGQRVEYTKELGPVLNAASLAYNLWEDLNDVDIGESSSASFDITIVGNSTVGNVSQHTSLKVSALRNASRTVTRYYLYDLITGRATGLDVGDSASELIPSLSITDKDLFLDILSNTRDYANVTVFINALYTA